jgi:hypothetical protein
MARRLNVQAKEITLIGSGRQGFCLTTGGNLGQAFGEHSDLDFTVISNILFQRLKETFDRWAADYSDGTVNPRNETERYYWDANKKSVPDGIQRGFIDPHKIPWWNRYREAQMVAQTMYEAHKKLKVTDDAPNVRKCSVRAYRDWDSFIRQMAINLEAVSQHAP